MTVPTIFPDTDALTRRRALMGAYLKAAGPGHKIGNVLLVETDGYCVVAVVVGPTPGRWTFFTDPSDPVSVGQPAETMDDHRMVRPARAPFPKT